MQDIRVGVRFALFNHGNVRISEPREKIIRKLLITPDMHRIHHSATLEETNSNCGFSVPCWDWLCKSYRKDPALAQAGMVIGIGDRNVPGRPGFLDLLVLPFASMKDFPDQDPSTPGHERLE
ncbi:MAG: sterol desaturase family protein [Methylococcales bacterium]